MKEQESCQVESEFEQLEEQKVERQNRWFRILGPSSLIYAIIFTICYHRNPAGIAIPVWIGSTIVYVTYIMKQLDVKKKRDSIFYVGAMVLLGISTFLTGNPYIILLNYAGFALLLVAWLLHNFHEDKTWDFIQYLMEIGTAVLGAVACLPDPFVEGQRFFQRKKATANKNIKYVIYGLLLAIPAAIFLGSLLSGADAVFGNWIHHAFGSFELSETGFEKIVLLVFGFFSSYCGMRYVASMKKVQKEVQVKQREPIAAITFTSVIALLYLVFSGIQIIYLFLGYGSLPDGMTYAVYARTGFFQLLFVSILNLFLVLAVKKHIQRHRMLDVLLYILCGCTFIMIASSAYRMFLYIGAYQLTFLRVFVLVALAAIALIMVGVVIALRQPQFPLFRYSMILVSVIYLCFSFSHIDYFIAKYNLAQMNEETKEETLQYLGTLSTDAAPVILGYLKEDTDLNERIKQVQKKIEEGDSELYDSADSDLTWFLWYQKKCQNQIDGLGIRTFNVSYYIASRLNW